MNNKLIAHNNNNKAFFDKADNAFNYFISHPYFFLNAVINLVAYDLKDTLAKLMVRTEYASFLEGNKFLLKNQPEKNAKILAAKMDNYFSSTPETYILYETEIFDLLNYKFFNNMDIATLLMVLIRMKSRAGIELFELSTTSLRETHDDIDRNEIYALWEQIDTKFLRIEKQTSLD